MGYLSATSVSCEKRGIDFKEVYGSNSESRHYYVHGKDNIPFHTIILPSLLLAHGDGLRLPDDIISSEYITLEGRKSPQVKTGLSGLRILQRNTIRMQ